MSEELVQGKYAGLYSWRIQWPGDNGEPEIMAGMTLQEILALPPSVLEGAEVIKTIMVDQVVPFCVKDGEVVLDA